MRALDDGLRAVIDYLNQYPYASMILIIIGLLGLCIGMAIGIRTFFPMTVQCLT